jgi:alpha-1,2-mannosyltransferase
MQSRLRQLWLVLAGNVVVELLIAAVARAFGYEKGTLGDTRVVLTGKFGDDSWMPMRAALDYFNAHSRNGALYTDLLIKEHLKFQYPPTTILIPRALAALHLDSRFFYACATYLFLAVTVLAVYAIARWSLRTYGNVSLTRLDRGLLLAAATLATLTFYPVVRAASLGQIQAWLNAGFAVSLLCYLTERDFLAGLVVGVLTSVKPQYGLFLVWGAARRNWSFTAGMFCSGFVGLIAGVAVFGEADYLDYFGTLRFLSHHGESFYANQTINGLVNRLFSIHEPQLYNNVEWAANSFPPYNPWVFYSTVLSSVAIVAACLFAKGVTGVGRGADYCLIALGATLASPIGWEHHYGILLPTFAVLWPMLWFDRQFLGRDRLRIAAVLCFLVASNYIPFVNWFAGSAFNVLQSYLLMAALTVFVILMIVRRGSPTVDHEQPIGADGT